MKWNLYILNPRLNVRNWFVDSGFEPMIVSSDRNLSPIQ